MAAPHCRNQLDAIHPLRLAGQAEAGGVCGATQAHRERPRAHREWLRQTRRRAFTLLELMLVMAVLVTIVALAMPALSGPLDNHRLRRGADQVRAAWGKARTQAMETGRTYVFRYEAGGGNYVIEPWIANDDYLESDQLMMSGLSTDPTAGLLAAQLISLPENVTFAVLETTRDLRSVFLAANSPTSQTNSQLPPPIFFYADGTASTARLTLANQRGSCVTLTMRGLTGVVQVSGLQTREEALQ